MSDRLEIETSNFSILWWIGVMETFFKLRRISLQRDFSILWWIGVMETDRGGGCMRL